MLRNEKYFAKKKIKKKAYIYIEINFYDDAFNKLALIFLFKN